MGKFYQRFGPINGPAGKRRLNVLFSRAKEQIVTFSSIPLGEFNPSPTNEGATLLRRWLEFSATKRLGGGLTKSEVARQAALKTCDTKRFPEIKKSRQSRDRSISFVMSESLKEEFLALCKEHKTSMSAVIRHYLMNPQDLFTKKGKNYSKNRSRHLRNDNDLYQTPYSMTRRLLQKEHLEGSILEPACGEGAIVHVLKEFGYEPTAYDIELDFLKETRKFSSVITNPPYSLAAEFISKCKQVAEHRFYLLLPLSYLHGKSRYDTFYSDSDFGLRKIYIFTRNPMFEQSIRKDGRYKTGMQIYAWYIFENGYDGEPVMDWIDNHEDVVRK